jgi:hypothetical protein
MENTKDENVQDQGNRPKPPNSEFDEAVDRVYRKYGSDLAAFVRDVQKELQKQADNNKRSACGTFL